MIKYEEEDDGEEFIEDDNEREYENSLDAYADWRFGEEDDAKRNAEITSAGVNCKLGYSIFWKKTTARFGVRPFYIYITTVPFCV